MSGFTASLVAGSAGCCDPKDVGLLIANDNESTLLFDIFIEKGASFTSTL